MSSHTDAAASSTAGSNHRVPSLIYGTAWKKERTTELVVQALRAGFKGIDTAAQPKHYREDLVGDGVRQAVRDGLARREELYIQTKYSPYAGEDAPYNAHATIAEQVQQSVASSLHSFRSLSETNVPDQEPYLDCLVLHSPLPTLSQTMEAWTAMESFVPSKIRTLGISNTDLRTLVTVHEHAKTKPSVVQNRFYPATHYDVMVRAFCNGNNIRYQSFWTLTANPHLLVSSPVRTLASEAHISVQAALYSLVIGLGNVSVLNGTTNEGRMRKDLEEVERVQEFKSSDTGRACWQKCSTDFERMIIMRG